MPVATIGSLQAGMVSIIKLDKEVVMLETFILEEDGLLVLDMGKKEPVENKIQVVVASIDQVP